MPQQNGCLSFTSNPIVSCIDYSEAQNILELTTTKQKQLRRQRSQVLHRQVLLKRTYSLVCDLLDSDCSYSSNETSKSPLSSVDTNKRKLSLDDNDIQLVAKKSKSLMDKCYDIKNDDDILQFLRELNSTKVTSSDDDQQNIPIFIFLVIIVWRLVEETKQVYYWYLLLLLIFLLIESYITVYKRKGYEYKWFCSSSFAYLIAIVPCIWLLELNHSFHVSLSSNQTKLSFDIPRRFELTSSAANGYLDNFDADDSDSKENSILDKPVNMLMNKESYTKNELTTTATSKQEDLNLKKLLQKPQELILKLNTHLSREEWHMIIEQMTLLVLILSRWLLPKGELTREELSQLLLVYIGIAADIIEFFEVFKEKSVRTNLRLSILVLLLWTFSLLQFCLAFTISRARKTRLLIKQKKQENRFLCSPSDFWGMLMSLFLQDIPFFSFRAVLIFHYHIFSYSTVFFTSKNGLIIILQWYRITVILAATVSEERRHHRYHRKVLIPIIETNPDGRTINKTEDLLEKETTTNHV